MPIISLCPLCLEEINTKFRYIKSIVLGYEQFIHEECYKAVNIPICIRTTNGTAIKVS